MAGEERGSGFARPSEGPGDTGVSAERRAHKPPDKMSATQAPIIALRLISQTENRAY